MKQELTVLPLEPLKARYTELLHDWEKEAFASKFKVTSIIPDIEVPTVIHNGSVLDSVNRPLWALQQITELLANSRGGLVYFSDFFHPGLEALPYSGRNYQAFAFCWAQTFDRFDFTRPMVSWMRPYEAMAMSIFRGIFVASPVLADLITTVFPDCEGQVHYVGLPFNSTKVRGIFDSGFHPGPYDVVFSSRFDLEKRPGFFLDLVETMPKVSFAVCTGHEELRGNDYSSVARARHLREIGRLTIHSNLTKPEYYSVLKASKVQFNCSQQDWVSFTLLEALTHGCFPVYPAWRDFPVVFEHAPACLYAPSSLADARIAIQTALETEKPPKELQAELTKILAFHDGSLERIGDTILRLQ